MQIRRLLDLFVLTGVLFTVPAYAQTENGGVSLISNVSIGVRQALVELQALYGVISSFSELLNIVLIILSIFFISTIYNLVQCLQQRRYTVRQKLSIIPPLIAKSASRTFTEFSYKDEHGTYICSFDQHKRLHSLTRKVLGGTGAVLIVKGVLAVVLGYFLSVQLPARGIAQSFPFTQDGAVVQRNDVLTYIMEFENTGTADASGVVLTNQIDTTKVVYVPGSGKITKNGIETTTGVSYSAGTVTFTVGTVGQGVRGNVIFSVQVKDDPSIEGQVIINSGQLTALNAPTLNSNVVSNPIGIAVPISTTLVESGYEGIFEPLCCAGGGTSCDDNGNSKDDVNCETGLPLLGTHKHRFVIPFSNIPQGTGNLNCTITRPGNIDLSLLIPYTVTGPGDEAQLEYKLTTTDAVSPQGGVWTIDTCGYNIGTGGLISVPALSGKKIYVHGNTWTGVDSPTSDAKRALDCYAGAVGTYFDNTEKCDFGGDVAFAMALAGNASVEGICNDGSDNDGNGIIDCNDSSCRGISYPSCTLVGGALIASGNDACAGNICTGSVTVAGRNITFAYTQHARPGGRFKVQFNNGSVSGTTGGISNYISFIPEFGAFGKYAGPGAVTLPDDSVFPNPTNPTTYQTQATSINGTVNQVMWTDLKSTTDTGSTDPFELLITYDGGLQRVVGPQLYPDTLAPSNNDESQEVSALGLTNTCADGIDNDLDFVSDCLDNQCDGKVGNVSSGALCQYGTELTCNDGFDNDGDGLIDCRDSDCNGKQGGTISGVPVYCEFGVEQSTTPAPNHCTDGFDNDADGAIDCLDQTACWKQSSRGCPATETSCIDGVDNDFDSNYSNNYDADPATGADCTDYDCAGNPACPATENINGGAGCFDGIDNDLDAKTDCFDPDCAGVEYNGQACLAKEFTLGIANLCTDLVENDYDEPTPRLDCADNQSNRAQGSPQATTVASLEATDCWARFEMCAPCPSIEFITYDACADGKDNDYDNGSGSYAPDGGGRDCSDSDCVGKIGNYAGALCGTEVCTDNFDNDADGAADCRDSDCVGKIGPDGIVCEPGTELSCNDGIDNDFGGGTDCFDSDCEGKGSCAPLNWNTTACTQVPFTTGWVNMVSGGTIQYRHTSRLYQGGAYTVEFRGQASSYDSLLITIGQGQFPFDVYNCALSGTSGLTYSATDQGVGKIQNSVSPLGPFAVTLTCPTNGLSAGFSASYPMSITANGVAGIELGQVSTNPSVSIFENIPPVVQGIEIEGLVGGTVRKKYGSNIGVRGLPSDAGTGSSGICGCIVSVNGIPVTTGSSCQGSLAAITQDGPHTVSVSAIDGASNGGGAANTTVIVDVTPVEVNYQKLNRAYYNNTYNTVNVGTIQFRTAANGSFGDCTAEVKNGSGNTVASKTLTKSGTSDITCTGTIAVGSLPDGQYTLTVRAVDEDGASVTSKKIFYVCKNVGSTGCERLDIDNDGFPEATATSLYSTIQGGPISCDMCPGVLNTGVDSDADGIDDACDPDAEVLCGNGTINAGETCDDGNRANGDGCSSTCQTETTQVCGNGIIETGETCDDGNTISGDGCSGSCVTETAQACGNGIIEAGETCDDGNLLNNDGCSQYCQTEAVCGNGTRENSEQCDDANVVNGDGCDSTCQFEIAAVCGNGYLEQGELCDDGNTVSGDGCSQTCVSEVTPACGNNILEAGETCDDGNTISGDGCSALCFSEGMGIVPGIAPPTISSIEVISVTRIERQLEGNDTGFVSDNQTQSGGNNLVTATLRVRGTGHPSFRQIRLTINSETKVYTFAFAYPGPWVYDLTDTFTLGEHSGYAQGIDEFGNTTPRGAEKKFVLSISDEKLLNLLEENVVGTIAQYLPDELTGTLGIIKNIPGVRSTVDNPRVEKLFQRFIAPGITTVALINTIPAVSVGIFNILPYLHLLFIEPFRALFGKKRKKWGVVYNSLTKRPVDLAIVRLYNKETRQLIQTRVTDTQGRYIMIVKDPGLYYLQVVKQQFVFPTDYLRDEKSDTQYIDLYHGEEVEVKKEGAVITANIPLDPVEAPAQSEQAAIKQFFKERAHIALSWGGIVLSVVSFVIYPTVLITAFLALHIALYAIFRRLAIPKRPKSWGIVYDKETKQPLAHAVVRIFDTKFNKLLETQVTDGRGRYSFLVGQNVYQVVAEKAGYSPQKVDPVDKTGKDQIVSLDLGLHKV